MDRHRRAAGRAHAIARSSHHRHNHRLIPFRFRVVNGRDRQVRIRLGGEGAARGQLLVINAIDGGARESPTHLDRLRGVTGPVKPDHPGIRPCLRSIRINRRQRDDRLSRRWSPVVVRDRDRRAAGRTDGVSRVRRQGEHHSLVALHLTVIDRHHRDRG